MDITSSSVTTNTTDSIKVSYAAAVANSTHKERTNMQDKHSNLHCSNRELLDRIASLESELKTERERNNLLSEFYGSDQKAIVDTTKLLQKAVYKTSDLGKEDSGVEFRKSYPS